MEVPKQIKVIMYNLLSEPTPERFREFIQNQTGEHNAIDFKSQWIEGGQLAKEILSIANSGGGIIFWGVAEQPDHSVKCDGLEILKDHADISKDTSRYLSSDLKYDIYDFVFNSSEYEALIGRSYQMMVIEDTPAYIPFLAKKESGVLKTNEIYIRRGTSCEAANQEEIRNIINRRINYAHPLDGEPLSLNEHLQQLKVLYEKIDKEIVHYDSGLFAGLSVMLSEFAKAVSTDKRTVTINPLYPDESYDEFVSRLIVEKKKKIERVLDLY